MALYLEVLSGELQGTRTPVQDGLVIGRKEGLLTIRDSKLSGRHVKVEKRLDASFWLVDLESSNGIKVKETRVRELKLESGVHFTLGRTPFQVISTDDHVSDDIPTAAMAVTVTRTFWDNIREIAERGLEASDAPKTKIREFSPVVRLKFIRGTQTGTEWTLGYGPRAVGSAAIDLHLSDGRLPEICFRIVPEWKGKIGVFVVNEADQAVRLNSRGFDFAPLNDGDVIDLLSAQIQVSIDAK